MTLTFDWQSLEDRLFEQSNALIQRFATEHPEVTCSFFAYMVNPRSGEFFPSFDSDTNLLRTALEDRQHAPAGRKQMLSQEWCRRTARYRLHSLSDSCPDVGCFAYPVGAKILFKELEALSMSVHYLQAEHAVEGDYVPGNVRIMLWKVVERLVADDAFVSLHVASPFRVGYQFHDDSHFVVLRLLN